MLGAGRSLPARAWSWLPVAFVALFAGLAPAPAPGAQDDARLPALFEKLADAADSTTAQAIEADIWSIWLESGDPRVDRLMAEGIEAMNEGRHEAALERFDRIVVLAPGFAEGWNKRATVYWLLGRPEDSVADIRRTLALEPRHFGALSGMGLIFLERGDIEGALRAFEAVLAISPESPGTREKVEVLRERLRDREV